MSVSNLTEKGFKSAKVCNFRLTFKMCLVYRFAPFNILPSNTNKNMPLVKETLFIIYEKNSFESYYKIIPL